MFILNNGILQCSPDGPAAEQAAREALDGEGLVDVPVLDGGEIAIEDVEGNIDEGIGQACRKLKGKGIAVNGFYAYCGDYEGKVFVRDNEPRWWTPRTRGNTKRPTSGLSRFWKDAATKSPKKLIRKGQKGMGRISGFSILAMLTVAREAELLDGKVIWSGEDVSRAVVHGDPMRRTVREFLGDSKRYRVSARKTLEDIVAPDEDMAMRLAEEELKNMVYWRDDIELSVVGAEWAENRPNGRPASPQPDERVKANAVSEEDVVRLAKSYDADGRLEGGAEAFACDLLGVSPDRLYEIISE